MPQTEKQVFELLQTNLAKARAEASKYKAAFEAEKSAKFTAYGFLLYTHQIRRFAKYCQRVRK